MEEFKFVAEQYRLINAQEWQEFMDQLFEMPVRWVCHNTLAFSQAKKVKPNNKPWYRRNRW